MITEHQYIFKLATILIVLSKTHCLLYPKQSETRELQSLDGIWNFVASNDGNKLQGFDEQWYNLDLETMDEGIPMPVPSSYNDITQDGKLRDHLGVVWYDRKFFVPKTWISQRVWLRFASVNYAAQVYVNGKLAMGHEIGHLPFEREITHLVIFGGQNKVTVACDNTLLPTTVPQGNVHEVQTDNGKKYMQSYTFDFFNYAGIHRPVTLYTTPYEFIKDIAVRTTLEEDGETGTIYYIVTTSEENNPQAILTLRLLLLDKEGQVVASTEGTPHIEGVIVVTNARLWWPYLMDPDPGYMYTLMVQLIDDKEQVLDIYREQIGIREVTWSNSSILINNRPIYFHGFGKHEDSDIRGKGLDLPLMVKDFNLIKWVGANVFRTSHYPYADEIMHMADKMGIMVIDECPSVNTEIFSATLLEKHKNSLTELISRDKNRPSVIAWSIANEPRTQTAAAGRYFGDVANHTRSLDNSRPITLAVARGVYEDKSGEHLDFISFNRYNGWYSNGGRLDMVTSYVVKEATSWHEKFNKPVLMAEYGGDTIPGMHLYPEYIWSEEFQVALFSKHFEAFDILRDKEWFIGEFVWNFADFKTDQTYTRAGGNNKGIFTRQRQPKASALHLRRRYFQLANQMFNATLPDDLFYYTAPTVHQNFHDEF